MPKVDHMLEKVGSADPLDPVPPQPLLSVKGDQNIEMETETKPSRQD